MLKRRVDLTVLNRYIFTVKLSLAFVEDEAILDNVKFFEKNSLKRPLST